MLVIAAGGIIALTRGTGKDSHLIRGTSLLMGELGDGDVQGTWNDCQGTGGYDDFGPGQNVSVVDADGKLIGTSRTESVDTSKLPTIVDMDKKIDTIGLDSIDPTEAEAELLDLLKSMSDMSAACLLYFEVEVPTSDFYTIEIGRRGEVDFSFTELQQQSFYVSLSLGG